MQMLKRALPVMIALGALAAPAGARAQERTPAPEKEKMERCECFKMQGVAPRAMALTGLFGNRARLGVMIDTETDADSIGARIEEVMDDSPAESAGLRDGDIITHVDGQSLVRGGDAGDTPGDRLIEMMRDVEPGDTLKVDYRRGREVRTATVITNEEGDHVFRLRELERSMPRVMPGTPRTFRFDGTPRGDGERVRVLRSFFGDGHDGLRLVSMNAGLQPYFGTAEGVLVLEADEDSGLELQPGDVILRIGGRAVDDPGRAYQILQTYRDGEDVSIEVMRNRQRLTVTGKR